MNQQTNQGLVDPELSSADFTGLLTGNADLEASCIWHPTTLALRPDAPPPGHEHQLALDSIEVVL